MSFNDHCCSVTYTGFQRWGGGGLNLKFPPTELLGSEPLWTDCRRIKSVGKNERCGCGFVKCDSNVGGSLGDPPEG